MRPAPVTTATFPSSPVSSRVDINFLVIFFVYGDYALEMVVSQVLTNFERDQVV